MQQENVLDAGEISALNLSRIRYVENNNEPDKNWYEEAYDDYSNPNGNFDQTGNCDVPYEDDARMNWHFSPEAYAAMLSADFDGHQQSAAFLIDPADPALGHWGIRNHVDITDDGTHQAGEIRVAMAGLASLRTTYVERMMAWSAANRTAGNGPVLPWDVFNFHHYSSEWSDDIPDEELYEETWGIPLAGPGQHGVSPERDDLRGKLAETISRIDDAYTSADVDAIEKANKEFWLSEFGYDTNVNSNQRVPELPGNTLQETQAQWIVRSILEAAAARGTWEEQENAKGFDKVHIFCIRDEYEFADNETAAGLYESSGLVEFDFTPKRSWYYVTTLLSVLGDQEYLADLNPASPSGPTIATTTDPQVLTRVLAFTDGEGNGARTLAVWAPTSQGSGQEYSFDLTLSPGDVDILYPNDNTDVIGTATLVTLTDGDEDGVRQSVAVSNNTLTIPVSERPVFILLNESIDDAELPCVEDLTITAGSCDYLRLDWANPSPAIYDEYEIFYSPAGELDAFDAADARVQLATTVAGTLDNAVIAGLDDCSRYDIWLRGVVYDNDGVRTGSSAACQPDLARRTNRCDNCAVPVSALTVTLLDNNGAGYTTADMDDIVQSDDYDICGVLDAGVSGQNFINQNPGWLEASYHPDGDAARIDFDEPYYLSAIYFLMGNGNSGTIAVQTMQDDDWVTITTLENRRYYEWEVRTAFDHDLVIGSLRLLKEDGTAHLARMLFCGQPVGDGLQGPGSDDESVRRISEDGGSIDAVQWKHDQSVTIGWTDPRPREQYLIRYGTVSDETDQMEQTQFEREYFVEEASTTFATTIEDAGVASPDKRLEILRCLCPAESETLDSVFDLQQADGGTPSAAVAKPAMPTIGADPEVIVSPNPARARLNVRLGTVAYRFYRLVNADGRVVLRGRISESDFDLNVGSLPAGMYRLHLISTTEEYSHHSVMIE